MSVNTLANFMAAVNATTGAASGIRYTCTQDAYGTILVSNAATGKLLYKVFYSALGQAGVNANANNTTGASVTVVGENSGLNDSRRYIDAQVWLNWLAAN